MDTLMRRWRGTGNPRCYYPLLREHGGAYICFTSPNLRTETLDFYSIPLPSADDDDTPNHEPVDLYPFHKTTALSGCSSFVALGSTIFSIGGLTPECSGICEIGSSVHRFDTTGPYQYWDTHAPNMRCPRVVPHAIVMDGKLYIIGGGVELNDPFAEYFDPLCKKFFPLPLPPTPLPFHNLVTAALRSSRKIFVASVSSGVAYLYDVKSKLWEDLGHKIDFPDVDVPAAVLQDTTLCWYHERFFELHVYHLNLKMWFVKPIRDLDKVGDQFRDGGENICPLFSLDDNHLCLLWVDHLCYANSDHTLIHCTKVHVSIDTANRETPKFDSFAVSTRSFVLETGSSLEDAFAFPGEYDGCCAEAVEVSDAKCVPVTDPKPVPVLCSTGSSSTWRGATRGGRGHGSTSTVAYGGSLGRKYCFRCGMAGHMARYCNQNGDGGKRYVVGRGSSSGSKWVVAEKRGILQI